MLPDRGCPVKRDPSDPRRVRLLCGKQFDIAVVGVGVRSGVVAVGEDADAYHRLVYGPSLPFSALVTRGLDQHAVTLWTPLLDRLDGA